MDEPTELLLTNVKMYVEDSKCKYHKERCAITIQYESQEVSVDAEQPKQGGIRLESEGTIVCTLMGVKVAPMDIVKAFAYTCDIDMDSIHTSIDDGDELSLESIQNLESRSESSSNCTSYASASGSEMSKFTVSATTITA